MQADDHYVRQHRRRLGAQPLLLEYDGVALPPVSVGGIAEQPDMTALPSAASSGRDYMAYIFGASVAFIVVAAGAAGWRRWRT